MNDEAKKHNQNLPGMGGIFNTVNMHLYHYAGIGQRSDSELQANNPVKYTDPDGREDDDVVNLKPIVIVVIIRRKESFSTIKLDKDTLKESINSIPVSSVPTMSDTTIDDALAPGFFEYTLGPESGSKYSPDVLTLSDGKLMSGDKLNSDGTTDNNKIPWRGHDTNMFSGQAV